MPLRWWCSLNLIVWLTVGKLFVALLLSKKQKTWWFVEHLCNNYQNWSLFLNAVDILGVELWGPRCVGYLFHCSCNETQKHYDLLNVCVIITKSGHYSWRPPEVHWAALMHQLFGACTQAPSANVNTDAAANDEFLSFSLSISLSLCHSMHARRWTDWWALLGPRLGYFGTAPVT